MKKVLLVYPGFISREVPLNLLYISAALKKAGYDTRVFELTKYLKNTSLRNPLKRILKDFTGLLDSYIPDIVGFSVMTVGYNITKEMAQVVKNKGIKVISVELAGESKISRLVYGMMLGDWVSYLYAIEIGQNPLTVPVIEELKKELER